MFGGDVIESQVKTAVFWELKRVKFLEYGERVGCKTKAKN